MIKKMIYKACQGLSLALLKVIPSKAEMPAPSTHDYVFVSPQGEIVVEGIGKEFTLSADDVLNINMPDGYNAVSELGSEVNKLTAHALYVSAIVVPSSGGSSTPVVLPFPSGPPGSGGSNY